MRTIDDYITVNAEKREITIRTPTHPTRAESFSFTYVVPKGYDLKNAQRDAAQMLSTWIDSVVYQAAALRKTGTGHVYDQPAVSALPSISDLLRDLR